FRGPFLGEVGHLDGTCVGVGGVGVAPLFGGLGVVHEQVEVAVLAAVFEGLTGRVRHGLPDRFVGTTLEGVDVGGCVVAAVPTEPVPVDVVHVQQPVHAVDLIGAVGTAQFIGEGVLTDLDVLGQRHRVVTRFERLGDVGGRIGGVVGVVGGLVLGTGDDEGLHRFPGGVERVPVTGQTSVGGFQPQV